MGAEGKPDGERQMNIGVLWGSFCRHEALGVIEEPVERVCKAHEYGLNCYQFSDGREVSFGDEEGLRAMRVLLDDLGMGCNITTGLVRPAREGDEGPIRRAFDAAAALDALCVCAHWSPGMNARWKEHWDQQKADEYVNADIEATAKLAEFAEEYGIRLAFENHLDYTFEEVARILDTVQSPYVGLQFDTGNPLLFLQDPMRFARHFEGRIFSLHFKDAYALPDPDGARIVWCPVGEGIVDMAAILEVVRRQEPEATVILEFWAQAAHEVAYETREYWNHLLAGRREALPVLERIKVDLGRDRPELGTTDEEGLEEEVHAMRDFPRFVEETLQELER